MSEQSRSKREGIVIDTSYSSNCHMSFGFVHWRAQQSWVSCDPSDCLSPVWSWLVIRYKGKQHIYIYNFHIIYFTLYMYMHVLLIYVYYIYVYYIYICILYIYTCILHWYLYILNIYVCQGHTWIAVACALK